MYNFNFKNIDAVCIRAEELVGLMDLGANRI